MIPFLSKKRKKGAPKVCEALPEQPEIEKGEIHAGDVLWKVLEGSNNLGASTAIYLLKGFDKCFNFCSFPDYD